MNEQGGALAAKDNKAWRWIFFLNLPLTGVAFLLVMLFLNVRTPEGSITSKLARVDWLYVFLYRECPQSSPSC